MISSAGAWRKTDMLEHPFEPVVDEGCTVLVLGSFPSVKSRENGFYYGYPRNRFWPMLAAVYGEEVPADIPSRKALLLRRHIALWDAALCCDADGSMDRDIRNVIPTDLTPVLSRADIRLVLANGALAGSLYRRYQQKASGIPAVILPSTSPANAAWSLQRLCRAWSNYLPGQC